VVGQDGAIGVVNWFAVHPTSMTFDNRLISGDHKGFASSTWEMDNCRGLLLPFQASINN
jgi:neutral ceramidase